MKLTIHRGTHQIGGTCIELNDGETRLILDVGSPLDADLGDKSLEAVGKLLPKVKGLFKRDPEKSPDAVFISHTHPDHAAFLSYVKDSTRVLMSKTSQMSTDAINMFTFQKPAGYSVEEIDGHHERNKPVNIGGFEITPFDMDHSAPGALAFIIKHRQENKTIVYTGDFRSHGKKWPLTEMFAKRIIEQPDYMLMEGTMVGNERGSEELTENELETRITEELLKRDAPVIANFSMTNGDRLIVFLNACMKAGFELLLDPAAAYMYDRYYELNWTIKDINELDAIKVLDIWGHFDALKQSDNGVFKEKIKDKIINPWDAFKKPNRVVVLREGHIRIYKHTKFPAGTFIMMSKWFERPYPGQEKQFEDYIKFAAEKGLEIQKHKWHVSGHAYVKDLVKFADTVKPKELIPIHTEHPGAFTAVFNNHKIRHLEDGIPQEI